MGHRDVKTAMRHQHPEVDIVRAALNPPRDSGPQTGLKKFHGTLYGTLLEPETRKLLKTMVSAEGIEPSTY